MDEVFAILAAVGALIIGLLGVGWACGDFRSSSISAAAQSRTRSLHP